MDWLPRPLFIGLVNSCIEYSVVSSGPLMGWAESFENLRESKILETKKAKYQDFSSKSWKRIWKAKISPVRNLILENDYFGGWKGNRNDWEAG